MAAVACSLVTHAYDYATAPPESPAPPAICSFCPQHPELLHAPCPDGGAAGDDGTYFYAVKSFDFGSHHDEWVLDNTTYTAGLDLDCSDRKPSGAPVLCRAVNSGAWTQPLPKGVDNAFAQQILSPLLYPSGAAADAGPLDLQGPANHWIALGLGGLVIVVDHWNGQADDPQIGFRFLAAVGPESGGPPRFTQDERWNVYARGYDPPLPDGGQGLPYGFTPPVAGYVTGGSLVADMRSAGTLRFRLGNARGGAMDLEPDQVEGSGVINPIQFPAFSVAGILDPTVNQPSVEQLAQVAASCASADVGLIDRITSYLDLAPDMPSSSSASPSAVCTRVSFGMSLVALRIAGVDATMGDPPSANGACHDGGTSDGSGE